MKFENEVTVEIDMELSKLKKYLSDLGFQEREEYDLNDIYMVNKNIEHNNDPLTILSNCILIRHIIEKDKEKKQITYKYKEYDDNGDIIKQGKVDCVIDSIEQAKTLFENLGYEEIITLNDHLIVYANDFDEFALQNVNDKHLYIEVEEHCNFIDRHYNNNEEMKEVFTKYNIPIKNDDYFVKKAAIEIKETLSDK